LSEKFWSLATTATPQNHPENFRGENFFFVEEQKSSQQVPQSFNLIELLPLSWLPNPLLGDGLNNSVPNKFSEPNC